MHRLLDRDLLSALVLFVLGAIALSEAGTDRMNWIFPRLAAYVVLAVAAVLFASVLVSALKKRLPDIVRIGPEDRVVIIDLVVFCVIVLVYMFALYRLGFWLSSYLMLAVTSVYMTLNKTRRNVVLALVVPLATCAVAYVIFLHVFYVPLPDARWWSGFR